MNRLRMLLPLCAALAGACDSAAVPAPGAAAARVNPEAITVREMEAAHARALEQGLDRAPAVLEELAAARREILARAYLQQVAQAQPPPSAREVRRYYDEHPQLFARRRVFSLEQVELARSPELAAALRERVAQGASLDQVAAWLRQRDVPHTITLGLRGAEQIPLELLPRLHAMPEGALEVVEARDAVLVIRVAAARSAPLDEAAAGPLIRQYLLKRRWAEAVDLEMRRLRLAARIQHAGEPR